MDKPRLSFHREIKRNKIQSVFLILIVLVVLLGLGSVIGLSLGGEWFFIVMVITIVITLVWVVGGYYNSHKIAIASVGAKKASVEKYRQYHHLVEGLCLASGMPKPKLYVMRGGEINAFASGRDPKNSVICVTEGGLEKLDKGELEGVLAHELSHIANYDIRFMTLAAVLVGMVAIISQIFLRSLWFGGGRGGNREGGAIFMIIGIVLAILAPIIVILVQLSISRKREYSADSSAVKFIRSPTGLIGALEKIKENEKVPLDKRIKSSGAVAPLFIARPAQSREMFQTHPPLVKRIARLRRM